MAIPVLILISDNKDIKNIEHLFSSPMFKIYKFNGEMLDALEYSSKIEEKDSPVIIVRDSSISDLTPDIIENKIKKALKYLKENTLIFLCKWQDCLQKYLLIDEDINLKKSYKTISDQGIIFSKDMRDKFIKSENAKAMSFQLYMHYLYDNTKITTYVFDPNLINYNSVYAKSTDDYLKTNAYSDKKKEEKKENTTYNLILFFFICFIIFLVAYSLINIEM